MIAYPRGFFRYIFAAFFSPRETWFKNGQSGKKMLTSILGKYIIRHAKKTWQRKDAKWIKRKS
jgi:hypothetical protein